MFNSDVTCPAPGFNTTDYPFPETQESASFGTAAILAGTVVTIGAALLGAAHYQMNKIMHYIDGNYIRFRHRHLPNKFGFLRLARKLAQLDPGRPSLLSPSIDKRTSVLEDLIKSGKAYEIREYLDLGEYFPEMDDLFSFVLDHNLDEHIPFLIESGFKPFHRFLEIFFLLDETRQNDLIAKIIGPIHSPLRNETMPGSRSRPNSKTLTEKQTEFIRKFISRIQSPTLVYRNESTIVKILYRLSAYQYTFNALDSLIITQFIENQDEAKRLLHFFLDNGLEINKDISNEIDEDESPRDSITLLDVLIHLHQRSVFVGTPLLTIARKEQATIDLLRREGAKTWAQLHPEDTAPATA